MKTIFNPVLFVAGAAALCFVLASPLLARDEGGPTTNKEELLEDVSKEIAAEVSKETSRDILKPVPKKDPSEAPAGLPNTETAAETDRNDDGNLSERELALKDHREKLKLYDLNNDSQISIAEWEAANKEAPERNEKFNLVDKDENGEIDEDEAVGFVLERISVEDTYVDANEGEVAVDPVEKDIEENAPSEVRFTLFSIPLGE